MDDYYGNVRLRKFILDRRKQNKNIEVLVQHGRDEYERQAFREEFGKYAEALLNARRQRLREKRVAMIK